MTNPPMTMEIDLASDGENGALDSEDSGNSYPRRGYEFPNKTKQNSKIKAVKPTLSFPGLYRRSTHS
jgi:hypothetical protein